MKNRYLLLYFCFFVSILDLQAQTLTVDDTQNVSQLINTSLFEVAGTCEPSFNESSPINGSSEPTPIASFGAFSASGNSGFDLSEGVVLATGRVSQANASTAGIGDGTVTWGGSSDYENALGLSADTTFNATEIEFDFLALQNNIVFDYVFASDEYASGSANFCYNNDGVVILIKETGSSSPFRNIALTPDNRPVTVANIHEEGVGATPETSCPAENEALLANGGARSPSTQINYTQYIQTLSANTNTVLGTDYTVKIIIADGGDSFSDSAVFIQKIVNELSLDLGKLEGSVFTPGDINDCSSTVTLSPEQTFPASAQYLWTSSANPNLSERTQTINVSESGTYTLSVQLNASCAIEASIAVNLADTNQGNEMTPLSECVATTATSAVFDLQVKDSEALMGRDTASTVTYFANLAEAESDSGTAIENPNSYTASTNDIIYVTVVEPSGCKFISNFEIIVGQGEVIDNSPRAFVVCDSELVVGDTVFDADGFEAVELTDITAEFFSNLSGSFIYYEDAELTTEANEAQLYSGTTIIYAQNTSPTGCLSNAIPIEIVINTPPTGVPYDEIEGSSAIFEEIIICDEDPKDGFTAFNLEPLRDQILASGITDVAISFHRSVEDAALGVDPIADPANYTNEEENIQRIGVRIVRTGSDCPIVRPITLKARHLISDSTIEEENTCDDDDDGFAVFDLSGKKDEISTEFQVSLYASLDDFNNDDPISDADLRSYTNTEANTQTIYVRLIDNDPVCEDSATFNLVVSPRVTVNTPTSTLTVCDVDTDGRINGLPTLFQNEIAAEITTDTSLGLSYYTNQADAENSDDNSVMALMDDNSGTSGRYWARATSNDGCIAVVPFDLQVNPAPDVLPLDPVFVCYDRVNSIPFQDISQQVTVAAKNEFAVSYFNTESAALMIPEAMGNSIPTADVTNYDISLDEDAVIWVRFQNRTTGCISVLAQQFIINTIPVIVNNDDFLLCVAPGNSLAANFNLRSRDALILGDQTDKFIRYYDSSISDANAGGSDGEIMDPIFSSTISEMPIYFRIENIDDATCFITGQFNLKIEENAATNPIDRLIECEGDTPSVALFNLQDAVDIITNNGAITGVAINFYANDADAGFVDLSDSANQTEQVPNATGESLPLDGYENQTPLSQEIVARITNTVNDCVTFDKFLLVVDERPEVEPLSNLSICDTNGDGTESVDLKDVESTFRFNYAGRQRDLAATGGVLYFRSEADRVAHTESMPLNINVDEPFVLTNALTDIYLRITSDTGCVFETSYSIQLNSLPVIEAKDIELCEDDFGSNSFTINNLTELNTQFQFVDTANPVNENVIVRYYTDAAGTSPIVGSYTKSNTDVEIYADAFNTVTSCVSNIIVRLGLIAHPIPTATLPDSSDLIVCDLDGTLDGVTDFVFADLDTAILRSQNNTSFAVTYHDTMEDAEASIALATLNRATTKSYVAKVTNLNTTCYNTVLFDVTVNAIPEIEPITQMLERCDVGNDNLELFALNSIETTLVPIAGAATDFTVRYFTAASRTTVSEITGANISQFSVNRFGAQLIYISLVSNTNPNCTYDSEFRINMIELPQINETTASIKFCEGELFESQRANLNSLLIPNLSDAMVSYHTDITADLASEILDADPVPNGEIFVKSTSNATGCENIVPITLEEISLPTINDISLATRTVCDTDNFNDGFFPFDYTTLNGEILGSQNPSLFTISYHLTEIDAARNNPIDTNSGINTGTYYVKVTNNEAGCSITREIELFVSLLPNIVLEDVVFCVNSPSRVIDGDTGNENDVFYQWTFANEAGVQVRPTITDSKTLTLSPADIGTFVTLEVRNNAATACSAFKTFEVSVSESAEIVIDEIIKGFDLNQVTVEVSSEGEYTYGYDDPDPANSQESNVFENVLPGKHTIWVFDKNGCEPSMQEFIFIDYFPYFTPNGSGPIETETWHVKSIEEIPGTLVYIYNRFGKLLKTLTSSSEGWDGTFNGVPVPTDDYWVLIRTPEGDEIKDHITLKR
ncbi:T9SS type B sorting domain-containing protein [Aquimarina agarivorans]|uniref:T9SS type B sorting domain-containing protein n=1 Tax=Aquimarina agarivorans TaxID=980584 RepID=UPI000248EAC5|nr:T9SS type B sorting domain-containing protein [Aquimarina agarivorans]